MSATYTIAKADDDGVIHSRDRATVVKHLPPIVMAMMQEADDTYSEDIPDAPFGDDLSKNR